MEHEADRLLQDVRTDPNPVAGPALVALADRLAVDARSATSDRLTTPLAATVPALKALGKEVRAGRHSEAELTPSAKKLWDATALVVSVCRNNDPGNEYLLIAPFPLDQ